MGYVAFTVIAVAALLAAEWKEAKLGVWIAKPLAAAAYIGFALSLGATESTYGLCILAGLVLCWFGDVFLIPDESPRIFQAGIGAFLAGHVAYAIAFGVHGVDPWACAAAAVVGAIPIVVVLRWLGPKVPDDMRPAVRAYIAVISAMVVLAIGAVAAGGPITIVIGALMFYVSDLAVARDRFVTPAFANGAWGLPLYFGAQLVLATTVA